MKASEEDSGDAYAPFAPVWAEATDQNLWNELLERRLVRSLLPRNVAGTRVLDAGCAAGTHAAWLADRGCEVIGIDASPAMIEAARARHRDVASFQVADFGRTLPFSDRSFDGILSSLALHHLRDIGVPLAEFARLLRRDGWLIVTLDHPASPYGGRSRPDYFATELMTQTWCHAGVASKVSFWRRPLGAVIDAFADSGFLIERIKEAQVEGEALRRFPGEAPRIEGKPTFIAYKAVLDPRRR